MKGILGLLRHKSKPEPGEEKLDSLLFTAAFTDHGVNACAWQRRHQATSPFSAQKRWMRC